jgi:hypothetical protein
LGYDAALRSLVLIVMMDEFDLDRRAASAG